MQLKGYKLILQSKFPNFQEMQEYDSESNFKNDVSSSSDTSANVLGDWDSTYYQHKNCKIIHFIECNV